MCSVYKAGSYLWLIDFVYHSTLGSRGIEEEKVGGDLVRGHFERERRFGPLPKGKRFGQLRCGRLVRQARGERVDCHASSLREQGRCKATWKMEFKHPWREAGPPNHHDDKVDSDQ